MFRPRSRLHSAAIKPLRMPENQAIRTLSLFGILLSSVALYWPPLRAVVSLALHDDRYFQIAVAPFLCLFLIYWERARIFSKARFSPGAGVPLLFLSVLLCFALIHRWSRNNEPAGLLLAVFAIILVWMAAFIVCYGTRSFKIALFPLCCLFFMIPAPTKVM